MPNTVESGFSLAERIHNMNNNYLVKSIESIHNFQCHPQGCEYCILSTGEVINGCTCILAAMLMERTNRGIDYLL